MRYTVTVVVLVAMSLAQTARAVADDIHAAVRRGDTKAVAALLQEHPKLVADVASDRMMPLHEAASWGSVDMVVLLIERGADVNAVTYNKFSPLHLAHKAGMIAPLAKAGANLEHVDAWGNTPLQNACRSSRGQPIVDALIEAGAKMDLASALELGKRDLAKDMIARDPAAAARSRPGSDLWGNTSPLGIVAGQGDLEIAALLIKAGADVNAGTEMPNAGGDATPLCNAVWADKPEMVELLLTSGAKPSGTGGKFYSSIFDFAVKNSSRRIVELLIRHGALTQPSWPEYGPVDALEYAARQGDVERMKLFLTLVPEQVPAGARSNALLMAALWEQPAMVAYLREQGVTPDVFTLAVMGDEPGVRAAVNADPALLKAHGGRRRHPLLTWAAIGGSEPLVRFLIEQGADVNERTVADDAYSDVTPLLAAVWNERTGWGLGERADRHTPVRTAVVETLLARGADLRVKTYDDREPLFLAAQMDQPALLEVMLAHGAVINGRCGEQGRTALHAAAEVGALASVKCLLAHGADPTLVDGSGMTPRAWALLERDSDSPAQVQGKAEVAKLLPEPGGK